MHPPDTTPGTTAPSREHPSAPPDSPPSPGGDVDLDHHGDTEATDGLVDLAVNVRAGTPPGWLSDILHDAIAGLGKYPDPTPARAAVAARHHRQPDHVLVTAGAADAFRLIAATLRPRHAVVVHPQFTEPEAALRKAGHPVDRVVLAPPFVLAPADIPSSADLVLVGNPTNPTSVLHHAEDLLSLLRPGRLVVIDEAFADCVPGEPQSLARHADDGLVVVRSLTKTWGLAGLRVGYILAAAPLAARLARAQPLWPVSTLALAACVAVSTPGAVAEADAWARGLTADRSYLVDLLGHVPGVHVVPEPAASFVLLSHPGTGVVHAGLRAAGFAARRADTFPGLGPSWLRVAVRDQATSAAFVRALSAQLRGHRA